ncbi:DNA repair protein SWI5 homolog [Spea bombifrons]|uniref:DNA repair protein SWI5 homolog n=1 Tax=Spea bombifrons TaxID=233779 RepID=UPI00234B9B43|nr:DNA repair protein SWI5 homolog [Spea bombifrons]
MSQPGSPYPGHLQDSGPASPGAESSDPAPHTEVSTPVSSAATGQRSNFRRTPLGIRRHFNKGFKSPRVESPRCSRSPSVSEESLQREISHLRQKEVILDQEIAQLEAEGYRMSELEQHISLLHQYNDLKDTGQMLLGRLAVLRGVTTKDLYAEFGMDLED